LEHPPSCDPLDLSECCPGDMLGGLLEGLAFGVDESDDAGSTWIAQLVVDSVSAELRPALLGIATQLEAELPDPDRAALWADIADRLEGE
jgi:hypothetical protein